MSDLLKGMSASEFYRLRDERTSLLVDDDTRAKARLTLSIGEEEAQTFAGQLCFLLLVSLSARWCRHIGVQAPDTKLHSNIEILFGSASLIEATQSLAKAADPFGLLQLKSVEKASSHIHIGRLAPPEAFAVMGRGWVAAGGKDIDSIPNTNDTNPLGPAFAAAIGSCWSLREAMHHADLGGSFRLSLWDYSSGKDAIPGPALEPFNLGRVLIVGAGAIGSGITFLLPLLPTRIESIHFIDADIVKVPNLNRSPLFTTGEIGKPKVDAGTQHLQKFGITASSTPMWFHDAAPDLGNFDLIVPGANEFGVQQSMMSNYPPLMIGASTGPQWDIHLQRHIPLIDDCLECRIPSERPKPTLRCGSGDISDFDDPGAPRQTGALPFLSLAASLLALAEIAKLEMPEKPLSGENGVMLFFKAIEPNFMSLRYDTKPNCPYCWDEERFHRLRSKGRFFHLSKGQLNQ